MLLAHPNTAGLPLGETFTFLAFADLWANLERSDDQGLGGLLGPERVDAAVRRFCDRMFAPALAGSRPAATVLVEKTPAHAFCMTRIAALYPPYPQARFVHLVRDGRDVALSMRAYPHATDDLAVAARFWRDTLAALATQAPALKRFREVRYESLLADPVRQVVDILDWVGLSMDDDIAPTITGRGEQPVQQGQAPAARVPASGAACPQPSSRPSTGKPATHS